MIDRRSFSLSVLAMLASPPVSTRGRIDIRTYRAPAEEATHAATWMCWPSTPSIYGNDIAYFEIVQESLGRLAAAIAENEPVMMLADASLHEQAHRLCGPAVRMVNFPTDDMWSRDSGPVFVKNDSGGKALVDFNFNGWGNRQRHANDTEVSRAISDLTGLPIFQSGLVGEGGGLEYDGDGTLILTESCWVNDNRNPGMSRDDIEAELKYALGVETVIWVPGVRDRDITDGHIDGSIRIVRPGLLMTGGYPNDTTIWGEALDEARAILATSKDARGRKFQMVDIPSATNVPDEEMFTGYSNYYVGNGAIYTPRFGDKNADAISIERLGKLYPDRKIVALEVDPIYENGGGIHCVTQQEPA